MCNQCATFPIETKLHKVRPVGRCADTGAIVYSDGKHKMPMTTLYVDHKGRTRRQYHGPWPIIIGLLILYGIGFLI